MKKVTKNVNLRQKMLQHSKKMSKNLNLSQKKPYNSLKKITKMQILVIKRHRIIKIK